MLSTVLWSTMKGYKCSIRGVSMWSYGPSPNSEYREFTLQNSPCERRKWAWSSCILFLTINTPHFWTVASGSLDSCSESLIPHPVLCISSKSGRSRENMKFRTCSWSVWLCMGNQEVGADPPGEASSQLQEAGTMQIQTEVAGHRHKLVDKSWRRSCGSWTRTSSWGSEECSTNRIQCGVEDVSNKTGK